MALPPVPNLGLRVHTQRYGTEPISLWYRGASDELQIGFSRPRL
jgi:hypothetical protein